MTNASGLTGAQALQRINDLKGDATASQGLRMVLNRLGQFEMSAGMLKRRKVELEEELEQVTRDLAHAQGAMGGLQQIVLDLDNIDTAAKVAAKGGEVVEPKTGPKAVPMPKTDAKPPKKG